MPETLTPTSASAASAQEFLAVDSIREGVIVLKHGLGLRAVVMVSSLNFALKSEEEQDALVFQYENFLNSLDFPLQFVIQSRRLNIQPYLDTLIAREKEEANDLLKVQIAEYREFVKSFVELSNIVTKSFLVIVPFQPTLAAQGGGKLRELAALLGRAGGRAAPRELDGDFEKHKIQLAQRVDSVELGLRRLGLRTIQLNTEELVELFYGLYNPSESQKIRVENQKR